MTEPDAVIVRIGEGLSLREQGKRVAARDLFARVWNEIGGKSDNGLDAAQVPGGRSGRLTVQ